MNFNEKIKIEFGIALTEKVTETLFHRAMQHVFKSIIKVIKKSFFI